MLRTLRSNTKYIALFGVTIPFVLWLATSQVQTVLGGDTNVVLKVDGTGVRVQEFQANFQAALDQYRRQSGGGRLTREDEQQVQDQVADQLISKLLLERAERRLGITVSDDEIIEAARSSPPPQILQQVIQDATFQTNGQFDITKWQRYLSSAPAEFTAQIEALYRDFLPQEKLQAYLTADLYLSDAQLWRVWQDQHEGVTVALLAVRPESIPDSLAPVTPADLERYYAAHQRDFSRRAGAWLSFVAQPRIPDAADTAAAFAKARQLHAEIASGKAKFADVAKKESADSGSGAQGGDLGWIKRSGTGYDPRFVAALVRLKPGQLSEPVETDFGVHLIHLDAAKGDSLHARHILIPIALQGKHLDLVDARTDTLDKIAAEQTDPSRLDSAARVLNLPLARRPTPLYQGDRLTLGKYVIPDVSVWAFEARPGETSPVIEGERASYVFRLDSLDAAGVPPLGQIRGPVLAAARAERKKAVARERAAVMAQALAAAPDILAAGRTRGFPVEKVPSFTRVAPPPPLAREPFVLGAAFGLRPGEKTGLLAGETGYYLLQGISHVPADSGAWLKQRDQQRAALLQPIARARMQQFMSALRAQAKIVDRRKEVFHPAASTTS
ncbi:MAG TPA: SurA N-terminal domain-containing protein [Gemmatimonadales bacterium]|jgi:peptidyl-prolyl cis-trans isomerase D|nr:SurA N-terminal domain-containing protein [Gemmatimonadales bacterium]